MFRVFSPKLLIFLLLSITAASPVMAQDDCTDIVDFALSSLDALCQDAGRNQVCYGNVQIELDLRTDDVDIEFSQPGDLIDLAAVRSLRLSPMEEAEAIWGLALMSLQPNLPDTQPGQNIEFILYGDVEVENPEDVESTESDEDSAMGVQSFYFRTGIGDAVCVDSPNSGIQIRTPQGLGEITLNLNEVTVSLGSVAYLQAEPGGDLTINMLEGTGRVEAFGEEQSIITNMRVRVPLDETLSASGPPNPPEPCDVGDLQGLGLGPENTCNRVNLNPRWEAECPPLIPFGMSVGIVFEELDYGSEEAALAGMDFSTATLEVNGEQVDVMQMGPFNPGGGDFWEYVTTADLRRLAPGTYTAVASNLDGVFTCTFEVLAP